MHENRETSETPATNAGRWAKATSRKAHMHVSEGSDSGVVCAEQRVVQEG
jgi:hypothetical protein